MMTWVIAGAIVLWLLGRQNDESVESEIFGPPSSLAEDPPVEVRRSTKRGSSTLDGDPLGDETTQTCGTEDSGYGESDQQSFDTREVCE